MPRVKCARKEMGTMAKGQKIKLGIVFGGKSGEHEVSLTSAASVINALDPNEFEISVIGITKAGQLANIKEIRRMLPAYLVKRLYTTRSSTKGNSRIRIITSLHEKVRISRNTPEIIFPLLHGQYGEDGTIQGLFEIMGLPYIGCGVLASAVGMDKDVMKRLFIQAGLPVVPYRTILASDLVNQMDTLKRSLPQELGYPMFSKPANLGSSVGVNKIHSPQEFESKLRHSAQFDRKILIEKGVDVRELECAVLGNDNPQASVVGEVISAHEFYDYDAKYLNPNSRLEIPARIADNKAEEIREYALRSFKAIDGSGLARVDFFYERKTGEIFVNEINSMPGFTPISMRCAV
jgi:D-alanine-D-alanine ligase